MIRGLLVVLVVVALGGCGLPFFETTERKLPGVRISVLSFERSLRPDPELRRRPIQLPRRWVNADWPQAGGLATHAMHHLDLSDAPSRAWRANIGAGSTDERRLLAQPVVAGGRVYTLDTGAHVTAFDVRSGKRLWRWRLRPREEREGTLGGGLAYDKGWLIATTGFAEVIALNGETGGVLWRRKVSGPMRAGPTIAEGRVFVVTIDNKTYALDIRDGKVLWTHTGTTEVTGILGGASPAVADGIVVVPYTSGELYALRAASGKEVWTEFLSGRESASSSATLADIRAAPVIDRGRVYAVSNAGRMVALDHKTGKQAWRQRIGGQQSPWVAGEYIYVVTMEGLLACLSRRDGGVHWLRTLPLYEDEKKKKDLIIWSGPVLVGDRLILAGSHGQVLSVSPYNGDLLGVIDMRDGVLIPPAVANRTLYLLTEGADLIALR
ncbi:MAG: PQQ-like beta-propeller repeat protein [Alphaproteobacteria bacterium]|nr:PQQ-like beta-propeller repeat protein [Alphaproteobacteria bacterium]